ncbi:MAG: signal peptide peptidase SppA, partial [Fidelibacterota bacterium]
PVDGLILRGGGSDDGDINLGLSFSLDRITGYTAHLIKDGEYRWGATGVNFSSLLNRSHFEPGGRWLEIKLSGNLPDEYVRSLPFGPKERTTWDYVRIIERAREDKTISGIFIKIGFLAGGYGKIREIRNALEDFKAAGKKVAAYMEMAGVKEYYLASAADYIVLNPSGYMLLSGIYAEVLFLKGTLEKLGIEAQLEHIGRYKTASDLLTRREMSDAHKEVINSLLDDFYELITAKISEGRDMSPQEVAEKFERGPFSASEAYAEGFADTLAFEEEMEDLLKEEFGLKSWKPVKFGRYSGRVYKRYNWTPPPKIAIIHATGLITRGKSSSNPFTGVRTMGSETISKLIKMAAERSDIKAIVFRIDSGGGSALASDIIWNSIKKAKEKKPFIVSMADVAASGGYFIASLADTIIAQPETYTGSIGIISGKFNFEGLYRKMGFSVETIKRGKSADMFTPSRGLTEEELKKLRKHLKEGYDMFLNRVGEGRKMTYAQIDSVGRGRVWTGRQAKQIGLVDELGGLTLAISIARKLADIPEEREVDIIELPYPRFGIIIEFVDVLGDILKVYPEYYRSPGKEAEKQIFYLRKIAEMLQNEGYMFISPINILDIK